MNTFYKQCLLEKGTFKQVAWIPEEFAVKDKYLMIGDDDGWQVKETGLRQYGKFLAAHDTCHECRLFRCQRHSGDYMHHRKRTDV